MESANPTFQLPVINIAPYLGTQPASSAERDAVSKALHSACMEYGFFYLDISQYLDLTEPEELTRLARDFFALPQGEKDNISLKHQDHARGYQRLKENVTNGKADNHEGIDFYKPVENPDKSKPLWGENQWPRVPDFQNKYEQWIDKMKKLGMIVMEAQVPFLSHYSRMAHGLGMNAEQWNELRAQVDDSFWVMRVIGYPPLPDDHDGFSCGAHKYRIIQVLRRDYGCLTLLHADPTRSALQVFLRKHGHVVAAVDGLPDEHGGEEGFWINADPIPGCIVCNIGESVGRTDPISLVWEIWTNGLYKSTLHRVVHRGTNYRIPFFFEPNFTANVKPLAPAIRLTAESAKAPERVYEPVVYGNFLLNKVGHNFATEGKGKYD
ncbi:Clavaminate synthase-like protein [Gyrodon lividus]|nr:Clavaminate synthase-like protein [Gyrodon lividus]